MRYESLKNAVRAVETAGFRNFVGRQLQARLRLQLTKQLLSEFGAVYLQKGTFLKQVANAADTSDTSYIYTQVSYQF